MPRSNASRRAADQVANRRSQVAHFYLAGYTYQQLAEALDVSRRTIASDLAAIREEWVESAREDIGKLKGLQNRRLDVALRSIWGEVLKGDLRAINGFIKIEDRRAKLLGLDAPVGVTMSAQVDHGTGQGMSQESIDLLNQMFGVPPGTSLDDIVVAETPSGFEGADGELDEPFEDDL